MENRSVKRETGNLLSTLVIWGVAAIFLLSFGGASNAATANETRLRNLAQEYVAALRNGEQQRAQQIGKQMDALDAAMKQAAVGKTDDPDIALAAFKKAIFAADINAAQRIFDGTRNSTTRYIMHGRALQDVGLVRKNLFSRSDVSRADKEARFATVTRFLSTIDRMTYQRITATASGSERVTGRTLNAADNRPVSGVRVTIAGRVQRSDTQGNFTFSAMPKGSFDAFFSKRGFDSVMPYAPTKTASGAAVSLQILMIEHRLSKPEMITGTASLTGTVLDQRDGSPLVGAMVLLLLDPNPRSQKLGALRRAKTDRAGQFIIGKIPTGTFTITITIAAVRSNQRGLAAMATGDIYALTNQAVNVTHDGANRYTWRIKPKRLTEAGTRH